MIPAWKAVHALGIPLRVEAFAGGAAEEPEHIRAVLRANGYLTRRAEDMDSPRFLHGNAAVRGFLVYGWSAVRRTDEGWEHVTAEGVTPVERVALPNTWCVVAAWVPFEPFLRAPVYLRTHGLARHERYELEPESGFRAVKVNYRGRAREVQRAVGKFATPVLISNAQQMVLSTPTEDGWTTRTVYETDLFPDADAADDLVRRCTDALGRAPPHLDTVINQHVAHCLFSVCRSFDLRVDLPSIDADALRAYEEKLNQWETTEDAVM